MQAPLSSTASGQELRTGPPSGLPPSTSPLRLPGPWKGEDGTLRDAGTGRRIPAWAPAGLALCSRNDLPVAEGAGLAHDAGNLLGALRLYCDLLGRPGVLRDEHRHYAEELQLLSQRSRALVDRLLHPVGAARSLKHRETSDASAVSVPEVIEQCRGLLNTITRRAVEVVYGAGAELPVPVSREALERILVNLTKNAAEASAVGGTITLRVCRLRAASGRERSGARSRIVLSIEDQGPGMSVAAVKVLLQGNEGNSHGSPLQLEEQPQRLHGLGLVSSRGPGRGLGLRVVRELVRASGGELQLKSQSGCGTTVEIAWFVAGQQAGERSAREHGERQTVPVYGTDGMQGRVSC